MGVQQPRKRQGGSAQGLTSCKTKGCPNPIDLPKYMLCNFCWWCISTGKRPGRMQKGLPGPESFLNKCITCGADFWPRAWADNYCSHCMKANQTESTGHGNNKDMDKDKDKGKGKHKSRH
jgi:hypothetical protein